MKHLFKQAEVDVEARLRFRCRIKAKSTGIDLNPYKLR